MLNEVKLYIKMITSFYLYLQPSSQQMIDESQHFIKNNAEEDRRKLQEMRWDHSPLKILHFK